MPYPQAKTAPRPAAKTNPSEIVTAVPREGVPQAGAPGGAAPGQKPAAGAVPQRGVGSEAAGSGAPAGAETGPVSGFKLAYPPEAKISLSKPASKIEDRLVPPGHFRSYSDIDFSKAAAGSEGSGEGPAGIGAGRPGQAEQRARRPSPGGTVALNLPGVDFSAWAQVVISKIQKNWLLDASLGNAWRGEVGVSVLVARNGDLLAAEIDSPSKIEFLDKAAVLSVRSSGPFPALPAKYPNSSLEVYFVFKYGN